MHYWGFDLLRLSSYPDTQRNRLGPNYAQIPGNCPFSTKAINDQRDGLMRVDGNGMNAPNYSPNSRGRPVATSSGGNCTTSSTPTSNTARGSRTPSTCAPPTRHLRRQPAVSPIAFRVSIPTVHTAELSGV